MRSLTALGKLACCHKARAMSGARLSNQFAHVALVSGKQVRPFHIKNEQGPVLTRDTEAYEVCRTSL
jgi:hypothetical protein